MNTVHDNILSDDDIIWPETWAKNNLDIWSWFVQIKSTIVNLLNRSWLVHFRALVEINKTNNWTNSITCSSLPKMTSTLIPQRENLFNSIYQCNRTVWKLHSCASEVDRIQLFVRSFSRSAFNVVRQFARFLLFTIRNDKINDNNKKESFVFSSPRKIEFSKCNFQHNAAFVQPRLHTCLGVHVDLNHKRIINSFLLFVWCSCQKSAENYALLLFIRPEFR